MKPYYLVIIVFSFSSCGSIIMNTLIRDAKVETTESIKKFQLENKFDTLHSFIVKADSSNAITWLQKGIAGYEIYQNNGKLILFDGKSDCSGTIFQYFLEGNLDSFKVDDSHTLQTLFKNIYNYQNKNIVVSELPKTDFYIVTYWAKFAGGNFGYKEGPKYYEDEIKNDTLKKHTVTLLKVNTDLQESWGMQPNGRMSVKLKVKKSSGEFVFGKLPIKK